MGLIFPIYSILLEPLTSRRSIVQFFFFITVWVLSQDHYFNFVERTIS